MVCESDHRVFAVGPFLARVVDDELVVSWRQVVSVDEPVAHLQVVVVEAGLVQALYVCQFVFIDEVLQNLFPPIQVLSDAHRF